MHNFRYFLKILFKDRALVFWTFAFPIILGTFFSMAFSNIEDSEKLQVIDIAIVENNAFQNNEFYQNTFNYLSDKANSEQIFNIKYVKSKEEGDILLKDSKIVGYLELTDKPLVVVKQNGIEETILKTVVDEIETEKKILDVSLDKQMQEEINASGNFSREWYAEVYQNILELYNKDVNIKDISKDNLSYIMIEFYTLIAMTCLYGGIIGLVAVNKNLANMGVIGKRIAISPVSKGKQIITSILASYIIQLIGLFLLFIFTIFVLNVDYGSHLILIVLLSIVGSLAGLSLGIFIATVFKCSENLKTGIIISVTMLGCFLSGMMGVTMKYIVDKNIPILNRINPASMITDGFYTLYYYDNLDRYYFNLVSLGIFAIILISIAIGFLRRQKYDSI